MNMPEILSAEELAEYLEVNYRTILQMAREGRLPGRRVGSAWRFHKQAIDSWLATREHPAAVRGQRQLIRH